MRVVSISWVRNEADILDSFVRHHAKIVDRMIIILHQCTDESASILHQLQAAGAPVEARHSNADYHAQSATLTALMHELAEHRPQWILPLDADEFLVGSPAIRTELAQCAADTVWTLPWQTYVPTAEHSTGTDRLTHIGHRRRTEVRPFSKILIPAALAKKNSIAPGNHALLDTAGQPHASRQHPVLKLAHFPVRSAAQLRRKILDGCAFDRRNPHRVAGQSFHWEQLHARCSDPAPLSATELQQIALRYALMEGDETPDLIYDPATPLPASLMKIR